MGSASNVLFAWQSTYVYFGNSPISQLDHLGMGDGDPPNKKHTVTAGESLASLAKKNNTAASAIKNANPDIDWSAAKRTGKKKDWIYTGETLNIPSSSSNKTKNKTTKKDPSNKVETSLNIVPVTYKQMDKIVKNSDQASEHYFSGNGKSAYIDVESTKTLLKTSEFTYVKDRLIAGTAKNLNATFDVDMTFKVIHIGRTNVDYKTSCTGSTCITTFSAYIDDGFYDPMEIAERLLGPFFDTYKPDGMGPNLESRGGSPYLYKPTTVKLTYKNPGYEITE